MQVFIECSGTEDMSEEAFPTSKFATLLDRYEHTIKLTVGLPAYIGRRKYSLLPINSNCIVVICNDV